ncbi:hypothetical protein EBT31_03995 [bacterium]|nr:hypothetical protein [bacterium]
MHAAPAAPHTPTAASGKLLRNVGLGLGAMGVLGLGAYGIHRALQARKSSESGVHTKEGMDPFTMGGLVGMAKVNLANRYLPRSKLLAPIFKPYYQAAAHAGMNSAAAGERGIHELAKGVVSMVDPNVVHMYEQGRTMGGLLHTQNMTPQQLVQATEAATHLAPKAVRPHIENAHAFVQGVQANTLPNRIARAVTGPIQDFRTNLRGPVPTIPMQKALPAPPPQPVPMAGVPLPGHTHPIPQAG